MTASVAGTQSMYCLEAGRPGDLLALFANPGITRSTIACFAIMKPKGQRMNKEVPALGFCFVAYLSDCYVFDSIGAVAVTAATEIGDECTSRASSSTSGNWARLARYQVWCQFAHTDQEDGGLPASNYLRSVARILLLPLVLNFEDALELKIWRWVQDDFLHLDTGTRTTTTRISSKRTR